MSKICRRELFKIFFVMTHFLILFFLCSCGTVRTRPSIDVSDIALKAQQPKPTVVLRSFLYRDLEWAKLQTSFQYDSDFEKHVTDVLEKSQLFGSIQTERFDPDTISFMRESEDDKKETIGKILSSFKKDKSADLYLNIYAYNKQRGPHDGQYKLMLGILHMLSLGMVPAYNDENVDIVLEFYDKNGKQLITKRNQNSRTMYSWTPALLWGGTLWKMNPTDSYNELIEGSIKKSLSEIYSM